jgi:hypothetical protein
MGVRLPLQTVLDYNDVGNVGAGSVAGGVAQRFTIPQDTNNVVVKLTASIIAGGVSATFQTTDDGGSTWYDVARSSIVSNANNTTAEFLSVPVVGAGVATGINQANSILSVATGSAAASTLGARQISGLPILSPTNRVFLRYTAGVTGNDLSRVKVMVNSQDQGV